MSGLFEYRQEIKKFMQTKMKICLNEAHVFFLKNYINSKVTSISARYIWIYLNRSNNSNINFSKLVNFAEEKFFKLKIINQYRNRSKIKNLSLSIRFKSMQPFWTTTMKNFKQNSTRQLNISIKQKNKL